MAAPEEASATVDRPGAPAPGAVAWPSLSVVIPTLDNEATIAEQLGALAAQDYAGDWEVVIADNGCTDGTLAVVEEWVPRVPRLVVVDARARRGINFARNAGARGARHDFVLFCDADDVVGPRWLQAMGRGALEFDGFCGPLDEAELNRGQREWRPSIPTDRMPTGWHWLPFLHGGNSGVRREAFLQLGGYDESYVGGGDDVEFSWRLQLSGRRVGFVPDAVLFYRHRSSLRGLVRQFFHFGQQDAHLYKDFRPFGMPRSTLDEVARAWAKVVLWGLAALVSPSYRGRWVVIVARRCGRLVGSVRYRTFYP